MSTEPRLVSAFCPEVVRALSAHQLAELLFFATAEAAGRIVSAVSPSSPGEPAKPAEGAEPPLTVVAKGDAAPTVIPGKAFAKAQLSCGYCEDNLLGTNACRISWHSIYRGTLIGVRMKCLCTNCANWNEFLLGEDLLG